MNKVAIIGAGPAGLAAARWLNREGFNPILFEQGDRLGGQWSADARYSGIWPSMHTNTCREMTQFSDLTHEVGTPLYPSNQSMLAYLNRYADHFDLRRCIKLRTRVLDVRQSAGGWRVRTRGDDGIEHEEVFPYVLVASGRFNKPRMPEVSGLESFTGTSGVTHTFHYKQPHRYAGQRVLITGCSVSALEIASDLAMLGAARVVTANRRQRYIVQKIVAGVPIEHLMHTRKAAHRHLQSPQAAAEELKQVILATSGNPQAFGAPRPHEDLAKAGVTQCQHYLPLVAEGRIGVKPWINSVEGQTVTFADGSREDFDGLIFGTGFDLNLPFFSHDMRQRLANSKSSLDLYRCTFHPDLQGLAFAGMFQVGGPYLPPIELQARWIAYAWSGARPLPPQPIMTALMANDCTRDADKHHLSSLMMRFARLAGVEPCVDGSPELRDALAVGPMVPASFRISGRDPMIEAASRVLDAARISHGIGAAVDQALRC
jgi:cation diffusion facilitator CzcD-associated flavoprotein CzcO